MNTPSSLLELIGAVVVAGGGGALLVYQVFKHLAAKWLDAKFDERLQDLKHRHGKEIEQLRFKINALLDRTTKLHQKEFEVLPEAWAKLNEAYWCAQALVSALQSYPDLDRMPANQLTEFIESCRLASWQKDEVLQSARKTDSYQEHIYWHDLKAAKDLARDANVFVAKTGIFINADIRARFAALLDMMWSAIAEDQVNHEHKPRPLLRGKITAFVTEGETLLKELERVVHERLWPAEQPAP